MKRTLLSLAVVAALGVNAQTDTDHICEKGFSMEFDQAETVFAIDTNGTAAGTRMQIDWWGCGVTGTPGQGDCASTDAEYTLEALGDGKLSVSAIKPQGGTGTWTPIGFSTMDPNQSKVVDLESTKTIDISFPSTFNSTIRCSNVTTTIVVWLSSTISN